MVYLMSLVFDGSVFHLVFLLSVENTEVSIQLCVLCLYLISLVCWYGCISIGLMFVCLIQMVIRLHISGVNLR
jgi:hypothetical protein